MEPSMETRMKGKRVLVTGSAGVIGQELLRRLVTLGADVLSADRYPLTTEFSGVVTHLQRDLANSPLFEVHDFQPEIIFHLAAAFERSKESPEFWRNNWHNNMLLSHNLIDLAKDVPALETFIFASSYLIYSPSLYYFSTMPTEVRRLVETDPVGPRNITGAAKYYTEHELEFFKEYCRPSLRTVNARIYRVYGCGSMDVISRWIRDGLAGRKISLYNKENQFDYIYAGDVAEGLLRLGENSLAEGIYNLGSGTTQTVQNVVAALREHFPSLEVEDKGTLGMFEGSCADTTKFQQVTGWVPATTITQGIGLVVDYERSLSI
jgi:nucleoside-diphosphate-sugar epimerase